MTQDTALEILKSGANVFLTGEPGSGKTHTINQYIKWLREHGVYPAVTASTGIAATHIDGVTIHSWAGIGISKNLSEEQIERICDKPWVQKSIQPCKVLIIDEVSMLDAQTIDDVEAVISHAKANLWGSHEPWGGIQIIFVGDFFQLPPVESDRRKPKPRFAFEADAWEAARPVFCYLTEQHRQEDPEFLDILTRMRNGGVETADVERLMATRKAESPELITKLFTHNASVDAINTTELQKIKEETHAYKMTWDGNQYLVDNVLKKNCLSPELLKVKKGALVMFTRNNFDEGFVNGTIGTVVDYSVDDLPIVEIKSGKRITAKKHEWCIEERGQRIAHISQIPLRLAWAITVHKSQGMSLDRAIIDLTNAFEYGQGYVALSRVRSLEGMSLHGLNKRALEMHPIIIDKDAFFKYKSQQLDEEFSRLPDVTKQGSQNFFLEKLTGRVMAARIDEGIKGNYDGSF